MLLKLFLARSYVIKTYFIRNCRELLYFVFYIYVLRHAFGSIYSYLEVHYQKKFIGVDLIYVYSVFVPYAVSIFLLFHVDHKRIFRFMKRINIMEVDYHCKSINSSILLYFLGPLFSYWYAVMSLDFHVATDFRIINFICAFLGGVFGDFMIPLLFFYNLFGEQINDFNQKMDLTAPPAN